MNRAILFVCLFLVLNTVQAGEFDTKYGETYVERETGPLKADLYIPRGAGPHPGVLVVHGGAWAMGTRAQLSGVAQRLAQQGFSAVAISYRLAPKSKFPAQIEDCKTAVRWMREHAADLKLDPTRIGGFGYSAGAHLVALLGTTDAEDGLEGVEKPVDLPSSRLQAVVGGGTPCDFRAMPLDERFLGFWLGGTRREVPEQYRLASPAAFVSDDDPPMFFFHGEKDELVPLFSPQRMCDSMKTCGCNAELYVVPRIGHVAAAWDRTAVDKSIAFLAEHLKSQVTP
ncbi:MAG: alpha/beta hydrolase [Bythopirellula sp.]|nr:alpha/beta hydrolase [Bythopirellula sp.]